MTKLAILMLALASAACSDKAASNGQTIAAPAATPAAGVASPAAGLPPDVVAFKGTRDGCDELRGEEPYDKVRAAELARELKAACTGTDRALAGLKAKYAGNAAVAAALADYEPTVE